MDCDPIQFPPALQSWLYVICRFTVQELISFLFTEEWSPGAQESGDQCWRIVGNAGVLEYPLENRWRVLDVKQTQVSL